LGKDFYDLNAIDSRTKYILAHLFVEKRTKKKCYEFLKQIKNSCYEQILRKYNQEKHEKVKDRKLIEFTCDKFANYKSAFMKLFGRVCKLNFGISIAYQKHGVKHNNNAIERYNGKIKDRIKNIRSGFKSFDDAKCFMDLRRTIHNFVNPNQELREKTPAEVAGINLRLGRNKLLSLIKYCARNRGISR
jgi:phage terminase small subunit